MLRNHIKVAFRNLVRHKGVTGVNLMGLTLGLATCLLIGLFVRDEYRYDRFVPGGDRIYRVYTEQVSPDSRQRMASVPPMYATALQQQFPEVDATFRIFMSRNKNLMEANGKRLYEDKGLIVEQAFFDFFPLPFRNGSAANALTDPASVVLTEQLAVKYFGTANPVGQTILIEQAPYKVTGVVRTKGLKFHLDFDYLVPLASADIEPERMSAWTWDQFFTYVRLKEGANPAALEQKFGEYVYQQIKGEISESGTRPYPHLQPLSKAHLYSSDFVYDYAVRGNITYVRALTLIALFVLLIACFNFVNLATAQSLKRAREVGVRKTIGASRRQLFIQFTTESVLLAFFSGLLAIALVWACLPALNNFTGKSISLPFAAEPWTLPVALAVIFLIGVAAGFYPALVLSGFRPVQVLKGVHTVGGGTARWLRPALVVVQFALSGLLIICTLVVYRQVNYLHGKDLGFEKEQILFFPMRGDKMFEQQQAFKDRLQQLPGVRSVSIGYGFPGDLTAGDGIILPGAGGNREVGVTQLMVDHDYVRTLGLELRAGRDFSKDIPTDAQEAFIINETAARELGFGKPEAALGRELAWEVWGAGDSLKRGRVIGVVKDFHFKSLYEKVELAVLQIFPPANWKVAVKLKSADLAGSMAAIEQVWERFSPDYPLEYRFLDAQFNDAYQAEDKLKALLWIFTGIAIFIGCLGLFSLVAFAAERRRKEIGIRKVLGASASQLVTLLSRDFLRLVLLALVIATPVAWYLMDRWLEDFAYRIAISWWIFLAAAALALLIAFITISFQAVKAALASPVKNLRTE